MSCVGTVKFFNDAKGWGFISCDGQDVFVHLRDCSGNLRQGDNVTFDLDDVKAAQGKYKAKNVCGGSGNVLGSYAGMVRTYREDKGWGIIDMDGCDVFFHMNDCLESVPREGDPVRFDVVDNPNRRGGLKAQNVSGGTAGYQSGGRRKGDGKRAKGGGRGMYQQGWREFNNRGSWNGSNGLMLDNGMNGYGGGLYQGGMDNLIMMPAYDPSQQQMYMGGWGYTANAVPLPYVAGPEATYGAFPPASGPTVATPSSVASGEQPSFWPSQ
eukprot:CAMPEP_0178431082 /NCGR_PEP_ID=MMETSP0689_2-20121128/31654_1 /TAXON_ID=160604 /ORGANISM="Amphidinium massartii, Strain CS-259" /LENGTH=267 /DNA_ID=CAMNT_0020052963 /DNA_START=103 /DNA_END=903 /DNA_ORIENTATION=-